jgi:hypothetical protein
MADASAIVAIRMVVMTMFQFNERGHSATVQTDYIERRAVQSEVRVRLMADLNTSGPSRHFIEPFGASNA